MGVKVLIIGSGGREHALGWKIAQSSKVSEVIYAPGNAGTALEKKSRNISLNGAKKENFGALLDLIELENIDLTIVGPEQPLADGLVDHLNGKGHLKVFGPRKGAAQLEADKFFSYDIMEEAKIPQAKSVNCRSIKDAKKAIEKITSDRGVVLKARGLAAGKGVAVCNSKEEALEELSALAESFGEHIMVAERLSGEEFSVFGISDGDKVVPIEMSFQDHKRVNDGDMGPNTGGMGAYGPAPIAPRNLVNKVAKEIMTPVVRQMKKKGFEYKGFLYAGMMLTEQGLKVIEFNVRFGDPECQPAMMIMKSDLYEVISSALERKVPKIKFYDGATCCVVLAAPGYPGKYEKGMKITGIENANSMECVKVFHAGTAQKEGIVCSGGRILGVTAYGKDIKSARDLAYQAVQKIKAEGGFHYRRDIANKAL